MNPFNQPLVSVIVLSFNRKRETLGCLESISKQTYPSMELVILDNGSLDGSADAIEAAYPHFRLIRMPRNYGDWEGRDIALMNTSGEFVVCIDNDATMKRQVIAEMVVAMLAEPAVAVVEPKVMDPNNGYVFSEPEPKASVTHYRSNFLGGAAMYRRKALLEAGGFPHYLLGGAEVHLSLRFLDLGYRILHLGSTVIYHDMSPRERIPHQRFYLSAKQRLRAFMAHYPGFARPALDFGWKLGNYVVEGVKRGFILKVPLDFVKLLGAGLKAWRTGDWRVKAETLNLMDYLAINTVTEAEDYEKIPLGRNLLLRRIATRLSKSQSNAFIR